MNYYIQKKISVKTSFLVCMVFVLLGTLHVVQEDTKRVSAVSKQAPEVLCKQDEICIVYRRASLISGEIHQSWSMQFLPSGYTAVAEEIVSEGETFLVFKRSVDKLSSDMRMHITGALSDVTEGREFHVADASGSDVFYIQENDTGVYRHFDTLQTRHPLKAAYFERTKDQQGQSTYETNKVIYSTYRENGEAPIDATKYINNRKIRKIDIVRDGALISSISGDMIHNTTLGFSHYRLELAERLQFEDLKAHYTIEIETEDGHRYFSGDSVSEVTPTPARTESDFTSDYANGIHFYDLFQTKKFEDDFTSVHSKRTLGVSYSALEKKYLFRIWAPFATEVELNLDDKKYPMAQEDKGFYTLQVDQIDTVEVYSYNVKNYGRWYMNLVDPYAIATFNDGEQATPTTHSEILGTTKTAYIPMKSSDANIYEAHLVDVMKYDETTTSTERENQTYATYAKFGKSKALQDAHKTGFTHIHILPIQENHRRKDTDLVDVGYETKSGYSAYTWGYGVQNPFAMEAVYATDRSNTKVGAMKRVREVKDMVGSLHERNLGVILDVGFNHFYNTYSTQFQKIAPDYYFRQIRVTSQENRLPYKYEPKLQKGNLEPLYEGKIAKGDPASNELAVEREMMAQIIIDASVSFIRDYQVDGLRYDLMGVTPLSTMKRVQEEIESVNSNALIYGEGWSGKTRDTDERNELIEQQNFPQQMGDEWNYSAMPTGYRTTSENIWRADKNTRMFNMDFRDSVIGKVDASERGFVEMAGYDAIRMEKLRYALSGGTFRGVQLGRYQPPTLSPKQYINFLDVHDDYTLSDHLSSYRLGVNPSNKLDQQKMAIAMLFTSQGIPILQAGSEFGRTKKGDILSERFYDAQSGVLPNKNHDNAASPTLNNTVIDYTLKTSANGSSLLTHTKKMMQLRASDDRFHFQTTEDVQKYMSFEVKGAQDILVVNYLTPKDSSVIKAIYNTSKVTVTVNLDPRKQWTELVTTRVRPQLKYGSAASIEPGKTLILKGI